MRILITGAAGFIGFFLARRLLEQGHDIVGLDELNDYYAPQLKKARLAELGVRGETPDGVEVPSEEHKGFRFVKMHLEDQNGLEALFEAHGFDMVVNLAGQAGVRYSLENPRAYVQSNVLGFVNLLECCRRHPVRHLLYASSSSVYGGNEKTPFHEDDPVNTPVSLYAATKRCDELIAHVYAHLYRIPSTGLRFFTVYGPWGRPDMAPSLFARSILAGKPINVFNNGNLSRDFTYIDDIIEAVLRLMDHAPEGDEPTDIYNVGCGHPMQLMDFIRTLEHALGKKATLHMLPMQQGDVYQTFADTTKLRMLTGFAPSTPLEEGIRRFATWYDSPLNPLREL
ncbi:NAD-dependent epimerase/dehydratase family protein [uncultured Mailhella sp.]|uniref:NAD-dependent epimerase/dehydratase family protein n=1 Tax=uncultured Mailhella sp. TaxID=1981031 RepID=UPI0025EEDAB1|nr:NAD-dependent epimerase/dehydratase family protein [uncultured Mailhella sp.]